MLGVASTRHPLRHPLGHPEKAPNHRGEADGEAAVSLEKGGAGLHLAAPPLTPGVEAVGKTLFP